MSKTCRGWWFLLKVSHTCFLILFILGMDTFRKIDAFSKLVAGTIFRMELSYAAMGPELARLVTLTCYTFFSF